MKSLTSRTPDRGIHELQKGLVEFPDPDEPVHARWIRSPASGIPACRLGKVRKTIRHWPAVVPGS